MSAIPSSRQASSRLSFKRLFQVLPGKAGGAVVMTTVDHTLMRGSEPHGSLACRLFFETEALMGEEAPHRTVAPPACRAPPVRPPPPATSGPVSRRSAPTAIPA